MADPSAPTSRLRAATTMLRLAWAADPWRSVLAFGLFALEALVQSLFALWLKLLLDGAQGSDARAIMLAAGGIAMSIAGGAAVAYFGHRVRRGLAERAHHLIERRLIDLV